MLIPFNRFADSDIWLALEACQLKEMVSKREHGLMTEIEEGGKNISNWMKRAACDLGVDHYWKVERYLSLMKQQHHLIMRRKRLLMR
ncbi:hypothetical protein COOONC_27129 [Cooperia oncophora]